MDELPASAAPGDLVAGRYTVLRRIGRGGYAEIYEARDGRDAGGRRVALKLLHAIHARDPDLVARFALEAKVQAMIRHRNVAELYDAGVCETGRFYIALELLRGRSIAHVLHQEGRVAPLRAAVYGYQALMGLAAAHAAGILHRDLKPSNLMLEPSPGRFERVVLIDFGFAALDGSSGGLTAQGMVVGSPSYLAPERLRGDPVVDARSDLYSIGVLLYELLAGRRPFVGDDLDVMNAHMAAPPPPLDLSIPPALQSIVLRALAKYPTDRAPSAAAMAQDLDHAVQALPR